MRKSSVVLGAVLTVAAATAAAPASANPFTLDPVSVASGPSPFAPGCGGPGEAFATSVVYQNAEVETHVAVNPTNPANVVAYWQQDRWSDGGAHGNLAGYSFNGGPTWGRSAPRFSRCAGGAGLGNAGDYQRATDPWLSFSPNGRLHAIATELRQLDGPQRRPRRFLRHRRRDVEHAAHPALRQPARGRQQLQRQGDADRRPVQLLARLRDLAAHRLAEREGRAGGLQQRRELLLGGVVRALDQRRSVLGARAGDLRRARRVHADDRQPGRGAGRRHADQRLQPHPRDQQPSRARAATTSR